jgi:hypothetical protein
LLSEIHGDVEAEMLLQRVQTRYKELFSRRWRHAQCALRKHLEKHILPGLADDDSSQLALGGRIGVHLRFPA